MSSAAQVSAAHRQIDDLQDRIATLEQRVAALEGPPPQALLFDPFRRLNPTERRIAELVAKGCTNQEVASRLFFSPKTVEWNLSKIYRKLHVRSRTELAAKLAKRLSGETPGITLTSSPYAREAD